MARGLRVVGGTAGGLHLVAPKGARPTTDRTKEALFSSLGDDAVDGATVLDLYAGSGALGIEALSRGAGRARFVDRDRRAVAAIRANLGTTALADRADVTTMAVAAFVRAPPAEAPYDLVFLDPPYDQPTEETSGVLEALAATGWLAAGATVVIECREDRRPELPAGWRVGRDRAYGDTLLLVATASAGPPARPHRS
jgi:16S rRNA (guanine966-N2)-methyltransferase